jgi:hypothetical protein
MHGPVAELEEAVAAGLPPREVASRFAGVLQDSADSLVVHLEMLSEAGLGPYRGTRPAERVARGTESEETPR